MNLLTVASLFASLIVASGNNIENEAKRRKPCCGPKEPSYDCGDDCGGCFKNYIQKMDFYHTKPVLSGNGKNWDYFLEATPFVANDGIFTSDCHGGLVDSKVFNKWVPPAPVRFLDNLKFAIFASTPAVVPKNGDLVIEFEGSAEVFRGDQSPFPKEIVQHNDLRFGYGMMGALDMEVTGFYFAAFMTNDRVYAIYGRSPALWGEGNQFASFLFAVPVKMRKPCDTNDIKIVLHGATKQVSWRVDAREVFRLTKLGYLIDRQYMLEDNGGAEGPAFPSSVSYGFGTGSLINAYPACKRSDTCCDCKFPTVRQALTNTGDQFSYATYNPLLGPDVPAVFWQANTNATLSVASDFIWGQGVVLKLSKLVVYQDMCATRKC